MSRFSGNGSVDYDDRIKKLIPGYQFLHQLTAVYLKTTLKPKAHILVVGAGTGSDILALAKVESTWSFTALDLSSDMLDIANTRLTDAGIIDRVDFHVGDVSSLKSTGYDAAICLFVTHFINGNEAKIDFLSDIKSKLKETASLLIADLTQPQCEDLRLGQKIISQQLGLEVKAANIMLERLETDFYPINEFDLAKIARRSGYDNPIRYFQAFCYCGYILPRV